MALMDCLLKWKEEEGLLSKRKCPKELFVAIHKWLAIKEVNKKDTPFNQQVMIKIGTNLIRC